MSKSKESNEHFLPDSPYYLSRRRHSELSYELEILEDKFNQFYPSEFQKAAHGDWRENSPKDVLDHSWSLDRAQLLLLQERFTRSVIIEGLEQETDEVRPGLQVLLRDIKSGDEISFTLVSYTDIKNNYLSISSNVGMLLLGKRRGDTVNLPTSGVDYKIKDILKPDETTPIEKPSIVQQDIKPSQEPKPQQVSQRTQPTHISSPEPPRSEAKPAGIETEIKKSAPSEEILQNQTTRPPYGVQRPQINRQTTRQTEQEWKKESKPLVHKDEERFNRLRTTVSKMGGKIINQTTSSRDLEQGKKETRSTIEFVAGESRFKAELVTRPKIISTQYRHTKRQGTSAEVTNVYGDEEIKTMYVYKLDRNNWVQVDFK